VNSKTGAVFVKKGTPAGTYQVTYDMNQRGNRDKMGSASATIVVRKMDQIPGRGSKPSNSKPVAAPVVYFNNDEPKQAQLFRQAFNYQNCFENYLNKIQNFYQNSSDSKSSLDTFFTYHVVGGYKEMNNVMAMIQQRLNQGVQVEISVSAYCSPIASTEYNNKLSTRRLVSITRFFKKWNDGALKDAIESNRITFWEHAVGELESPKDVSEDYDKTNESVYGIKASRERRVSITVKIIEAN
jgi:outer membrane protein OmpA-like peptidoglycan-associated protein